MIDPVTGLLIDGRPSPLSGCPCGVCQLCRDRTDNAVRALGYPGYRPSQDADLETNYRRYQQGLLVSKAAEE